MSHSTPVEHMYRIQRTMWEMLDDRGFDIRKDLLTQSFASFREQHPDKIKLNFICFY